MAAATRARACSFGSHMILASVSIASTVCTPANSRTFAEYARLSDLQVHGFYEAADVVRRVFAAEKGPLYDIAALNAAPALVVAGQAGKLAKRIGARTRGSKFRRRTADAREAHRVLAAEPVAVFSRTARG